MKNLLLRSSLVCLSTLVVGLLSVSCSGSSANSRTIETGSSKKMKFDFEAHDVKRPELVQAKLDKLFSAGSSLEDFRGTMEQSGAKCHASNTATEGNIVYCQRRVETSQFVKSQWTVLVKVVEKDKISGLKVTAGFIGV